MAADITSRSISGELNNPERENTSQENEEGFTLIENLSGDLTFVLLNALEIFSELHGDNMDGEIQLSEYSDNQTDLCTGYNDSPLANNEADSEDSNSTTLSTESLSDWEIFDTSKANPEANTEANMMNIDQSEEIILVDQSGHNAKIVDTAGQKKNSDYPSEEINQGINNRVKGDLEMGKTDPEHLESEFKTTTEELKNKNKPSIEEISSECEEVVDKIRSMKFNFTTHKHSKDKVKKKKWKPAPPSIMGFDFCQPSFRESLQCSDPGLLHDYEQELLNFENELNSKQEAVTSLDSELGGYTSSTDKTSQETSAEVVHNTPKSHSEKKSSTPKKKSSTLKKKAKSKAKKALTWDEANYHFESDDSDIILGKIHTDKLARLEIYEGKNAEKRLRPKHKWNYTKSHKAKRIFLGQGKMVYTTMKQIPVHHRMYDRVKTEGHLTRRNILATRSLKDIDKGSCHGKPIEGVVHNYNPNNRPAVKRPPIANRNDQRPRYALNQNNADNNLEADLVNVLINIQDRDLTPEDYELLLRLDERVAPKTVDKGLLDTLLKDTATEEDTKEYCTICMDNYVCGALRKYLPCGHVFHANCIDQWLSNASPNCPLDNLLVGLS